MPGKSLKRHGEHHASTSSQTNETCLHGAMEDLLTEKVRLQCLTLAGRSALHASPLCLEFQNTTQAKRAPATVHRRIVGRFSIHSFILTIPRSLSKPNTTLQVPVMMKCEYISKMKYDAHAPGKNWRRRRKYCYLRNQDDLRVLHPLSECRQRIATEHVSVIRHRV
jgi:hypothetical protein